MLTDQCVEYLFPGRSNSSECLRIIGYTQPPYTAVMHHLENPDMGTKVVCGPLARLVRSFAQIAKINCVIESGDPLYEQFYENLLESGADLAVGSFWRFPWSVGQIAFHRPLFLWEDTILGRQTFSRSISMGIGSFYSHDIWYSLLLIFLPLVLIVTAIECHVTHRDPRESSISRLIFLVGSFVAVLVDLVSVHLTFEIEPQKKPNKKLIRTAEMLRDFSANCVAIWALSSFAIYTLACNDLIPLLMSPSHTDRFTTLDDIVARNPKDVNVIYWKGSALEHKIMLSGQSLHSSTCINQSSEMDERGGEFYGQVIRRQAIITTAPETARVFLLAILRDHSEENLDGLYSLVDETARKGMAFMVSAPRMRPTWSRLYRFTNVQFVETGLFRYALHWTREDMRQFFSVPLGRITHVEREATRGGTSATDQDYADLKLDHVDGFMLLIGSIFLGISGLQVVAIFAKIYLY